MQYGLLEITNSCLDGIGPTVVVSIAAAAKSIALCTVESAFDARALSSYCQAIFTLF